MDSFFEKNVAVVGMGLSGVAAAGLLCARGARVAITDDRTERELEQALAKLEGKQVNYHLGGIDSELLLKSDLVVISPGVPSRLSPIDLARRAGVEIISEIELAYSVCHEPIIAITGTNGKTTTTSLAHRMAQQAGLQAAAAGNIEIPFSSVVDEGPYDIIILEVSSFQLENIKNFRPMVGVVLNLSPDHLDRYRGAQDYYATKALLFKNQSDCDYAVLNRDDEAVVAMERAAPSILLWFSSMREVEQGAFLRGGTVMTRFEGVETEVMSISDIPLIGWHNVENVLAAMAATLPIELSSECYRPAVAGFSAAEHRLETVREIGGVLYVNDSKATNVGALERSLASFNRPIVLIAGGRGKRNSYKDLRPLFEAKVKAMITVGEDAASIEDALGDIVPTQSAATLPDAVRDAATIARPGDCVLFAPACASFDMFTGYAHRGRVFKEAVNEL